jgi:serine/threonine protein kinase
MANVYLARVSGLGGFERHCVLKTLHTEHLDDDGYVGMFLDEAKVVAALHHQHIAQVFEVGKADDGRYFLAMEYLHGETARAVLDTAAERDLRLPLEVGLTITIAAAAGLHYAHERKGPDGRPLDIVHRDVSPSNVIVGFDGSIKLIDFGIAKASQRTTHTRTGFIKGKAGYMAPEQARGYAIDRRSDVFALGALAYELTTQVRAFGDESQFETVRRTVHGEVQPPSKVCPGYPTALDHLVMTALQTDPDERFQDADEMKRALEGVAHQLGLSLGPESVVRVLDALFGRKPEPWLVPSVPPPIPKRPAVAVARRPTGFARGSGHHPSIEDDAHVEEVEDHATRKFERGASASDSESAGRPTIDLTAVVTAPRPVLARAPAPRPALPAFQFQLRAQTVVAHRRRNALIGTVAVASALALGIAVVAVASGDTTAERTSRGSPAPPAPVRDRVVVTPAPPAAPAPQLPPVSTVRLHVVSDPPGATVVLDGVRLGSAPYDAAVPARDQPAWLKVRMPHRLPVKIQVSLVHDVSWTVKLPALESRTTPEISVDPAPATSDR